MHGPSRLKVLEKKYFVGIPIPYLDRNGKRLKASKKKQWIRRAERELTECFGATITIGAPGTNILAGKVLYEKGQILVLSGCDSRNEFLAVQERIAAFAVRMARGLNQASAFVLAVPSDSFLIEFEMDIGR